MLDTSVLLADPQALERFDEHAVVLPIVVLMELEGKRNHPELGDKTMLATITLATKEGLFGVWLGSTVGMVAADALAIGVGALLGKRLPERTIRIGASILFVVFGIILIVEGLR